MIVTIDGPAGSGKSTVARALARRLGLPLLDSGAIYRALALLAGERGVALDDDDALVALCRDLSGLLGFSEDQRVRLGARDVSEAIRAPEVSDAASRVSARPAVRAALLDLQRALGARGVVAEGRDMGTVVFPHADARFFLDASEHERARRRAAELRARGQAADPAQVLAAQRERDRRDRERAAAPLRPAEDAVVIDTTGMTVDEVVAAIAREVERRRT